MHLQGRSTLLILQHLHRLQTLYEAKIWPVHKGNSRCNSLIGSAFQLPVNHQPSMISNRPSHKYPTFLIPGCKTLSFINTGMVYLLRLMATPNNCDNSKWRDSRKISNRRTAL